MARNLNSNFNILSASGMEALSQVSAQDINRMLWLIHSGLFPRTHASRISENPFIGASRVKQAAGGLPYLRRFWYNKNKAVDPISTARKP